MQTNNVIRRENGFKQYCKSLPKSYKNAPKLVPATVLEASWEHLGHHRAFYSKTVSGEHSFLGGLWALGAPKSFRNAFWSDLFGSHFEPKVGKGFQNAAKIETQICDCLCFLEGGET